MTAKLYTVPVDILARYTTTVASDYPEEAKQITRDQIRAHLSNAPALFKLDDCALDGAEPTVADVPAKTFKVHGIFELAFEIDVPARNRDEAVLHARRLYEVNCGPFEFVHDGGNLVRLNAEEVAS
ncbi:MAG: hypothetical protein KKB37_00330 [Alphaproteobacteria bacterium]|nr:hypothetical protein [Alphaproteobacteria bacterium]